MSKNCYFCKELVNPHDISTWKQVTGWVGGPRKDSMTLREDTDEHAHNHCIQKAREGQSPDQLDLFTEDTGLLQSDKEKESVSIDEVLEENNTNLQAKEVQND